MPEICCTVNRATRLQSQALSDSRTEPSSRCEQEKVNLPNNLEICIVVHWLQSIDCAVNELLDISSLPCLIKFAGFALSGFCASVSECLGNRTARLSEVGEKFPTPLA